MYQTENGIKYAIVPRVQPYMVPKSFELPIYAHVSITDNCNLKCPYCYAFDGNRIHGNMSFAKIETLINLFDETLNFKVNSRGSK